MKLESKSFKTGGPIPAAHTCDGPDTSPDLVWTDPPEGTTCFALVCDDPDAPAGTWVHWLVWNIPAASRRLADGIPRLPELPDGTRQGSNGSRRLGYGGPCPPSGTHRYFFRIYALDRELDLPAGSARAALEQAISGHILAEAELMGTYRRS